MRVIVSGTVQDDVRAKDLLVRAMEDLEREHGRVTEVLVISDAAQQSAVRQGRVWAGARQIPVKECRAAPTSRLNLTDAVNARLALHRVMLSEADAVVYLGEERADPLLSSARQQGRVVTVIS